MNKKGFMMAELVIVSAIVLTTVATFYTSYNKIYSAYKTKLHYYDVTTLYKLASYRNEINLNNYPTTDKFNNVESGETVYVVKNFQSQIEKPSGIKQTFKDYIDFVNNTVDYKKFPTDYIMLMERCITADECYYAYLEVIY